MIGHRVDGATYLLLKATGRVGIDHGNMDHANRKRQWQRRGGAAMVAVAER
jgi:hypothetical protein